MALPDDLRALTRMRVGPYQEIGTDNLYHGRIFTAAQVPPTALAYD